MQGGHRGLRCKVIFRQLSYPELGYNIYIWRPLAAVNNEGRTHWVYNLWTQKIGLTYLFHKVDDLTSPLISENHFLWTPFINGKKRLRPLFEMKILINFNFMLEKQVLLIFICWRINVAKLQNPTEIFVISQRDLT